MKPFLHSKCHAKRWGGEPEEYVFLDDWIDQTKAHFPDMRHRAILHSSLGIFLCEDRFGHNITLSTGKQVSVRDIAEAHVLEDLGFIPTLQDYLQDLPFYTWLGGKKKESEKIAISESAMSIDELKQKMLDAANEQGVIDGATAGYREFLKNRSNIKPGYLD